MKSTGRVCWLWAAALCGCASSSLRFDHDDDKEPPDGIRTAKPAAFTPEDDISPSASKNGRYLAFASELNGNLDIWIRDYGTNSTYPITRDTAEDFDPAISPDGERVAFVSRRADAKGDLYVASIRNIEDKLERLTDQTTADRQPIYAPDGKRIYYTSAIGIGQESISAIDLESGDKRRISPTPGFDPAPSADGKYLVYTAAPGTGGIRYPHLVALRLSDSATRALTKGQAPEGFARFIDPGEVEPGSRHALAYVRFSDDDNGDGVLDANDRASLWRIDLDLDLLFAAPSRAGMKTRPLTDGSANELFPEPAGRVLYFTQGDQQQDIMRLPITGMFPSYADPAKYLQLVETIDDPRTQWFAYRCMLARADPSSALYGGALLRIGNLHLAHDRLDLARAAFLELASAMENARPKSPEAELFALAHAETYAIDRRVGLLTARAPLDRERLLRATQSQLETLAGEYAWSQRTLARVELELAEVTLDRGDRARAIEAFQEVAETYSSQPFSAAEAMLREIDLLGISHDPEALSEAYARILRRFPDQREAVRSAAERMVNVQLEGLDTSAWRAQADALRRLVSRYAQAKDSIVRSVARWRLVAILLERSVFDDAALELERLVDESEGDRAGAAKALKKLAEVDERRGRLDSALEHLFKLRSTFGDLPGYAAEARDAINRVGARKAAREEAKGDKLAARAAYKSIIDNDITQVKAHRRYLALSAETETLDEALAEAEERVAKSPRTPMARYAYGLALTWKKEPPLDDALEQIDEALKLNPKLTHALITRGWILEMKDAEKPSALGAFLGGVLSYVNDVVGNLFSVDIKEGEHLERALAAYSEALRLNSAAEDADTQAELWLNVGNASYKLGTKTNDITNLKTAFERYTSVLNANYVFSDPRAEMVYFERFGRAAAWAGEWATSAMATRRAIALAKKLDLAEGSRLGQLYGNLALAYDQAGEDGYAREAIADYAAAIENKKLDPRSPEAKKLESRLAVARRDRAVSRLETIEERGSEALDGALLDLHASRRSLRRAAPRSDEKGVRPQQSRDNEVEQPIWVSTADDGTSAQYGFGDLAELDLNLALSELAHKEHGEDSRAEALRARRRLLWPEVIDSVPKKFGKVPISPTTLLMLREKLGLGVREVIDRFRHGDLEWSEALLTETEREVDAWIKDKGFGKLMPELVLDRCRLVALRAELSAKARAAGLSTSFALRDSDLPYLVESQSSAGGERPPVRIVERMLARVQGGRGPPREWASVAPGGLDPEIEVALESIERMLAAGRTETATASKESKAEARAERSLPLALTSTPALAQTASAALSLPVAEGIEARAHAVKARLYYALGILHLADAELGRGERAQVVLAARVERAVSIKAPLPEELKALVGRLDLSLSDLRLARSVFELSVHEAAASGPGAGLGLASRAMQAAAEASARLKDRDPALIERTAEQAMRAAGAAGEVGSEVAFEVERALDRGEVDRALVRAAQELPRAYADAVPLVQRALVRSASAALSKNDVASAFGALDRAMLLESARLFAGELDGVIDPTDRAFAKRLHVAVDRLEAARRALEETDSETSDIEYAERRRTVDAAENALRKLNKESISDAARARIYGEPVLFDLLLDQVQPDEALVAVAPIDGIVHVLAVDGSTLAAAKKLRFARTHLSSADLADLVKEVRAALADDREPDKTTLARIVDPLFVPLKDVLKKKSVVILADLMVGGPLPDVIRPDGDFAVAHVSAPSALAFSRDALLVGVDGVLRLVQKRDPKTLPAEGEELLEGKDALAFRTGARSKRESSEGAKRSRLLEERSAVEVLAARAKRMVIVDAPIAIEPRALERSAIRLGPRIEAARSKEDDKHDADILKDEPDRFLTELPLEDLGVPAKVLVLAEIEGEAPGYTHQRIASEDVAKLDLVLAPRGIATLIAFPERVSRESAAVVLAEFQKRVDLEGPARAFAHAVRLEAKRRPSASLMALIGSPGLDKEATRRFAKTAQRAARDRAVSLYKKDEFQAAVPAFKRWIRLSLESGDDRDVPAAYTLLIATLADKLPEPDPARAADEVRDLMRFLEQHGGDKTKLANAKVDLGRFLSAAHYDKAAEETLLGALAELEKQGDRLGLARGVYYLALHFEDRRRDFKQSAAYLERAIEVYEQEKAFDKKPPPQEAMKAIRRIGTLYLNRLSDSLKARSAFERVQQHASSDDERNKVLIDLARVARRRGEFAAALDLADRARAAASKNKWADQEAEAAIEAANVAWYRGDYRQGQDRCDQSLAIADKLKAVGSAAQRQKKKTRIYALSVCGLLAMSQREFEVAEKTLLHAKQIAQSIDDPSEIATQYNNLGRVYLEFGKLDQAIDAFESALSLDTALDDHFALAYDLRNLGTALLYKGALGEADKKLQQALQYATEVQDANNELRARFSLGELARRQARPDLAETQYAAALPLAERFDVKELAWQIHRALGVLAKDRGDAKRAEAGLKKAVQIVRSITGRSQSADFGLDRYAAFDELMALYLEQNRVAEAFQVADLARSLEETEVLDDARIAFSSKDVGGLLLEARAARTASTAQAALEKLEKLAPRIADVLRPPDLEGIARRVPEDAAIVSYRVAGEELVAFVIDRAGIKARRTAILERDLREDIKEYGRQLAARADLHGTSARLSKLLIDPVRDLLAGKRRLAIVPHKLLRYVAFAALPIDTETAAHKEAAGVSGRTQEMAVDRFVLVEALHAEAAARALEKPMGAVAGAPIVALGGAMQLPGALDAPLPFAKKEIESIREEYPETRLYQGDALTKDALKGALSRSEGGIVHFAGHSRLGAGEDGRTGSVDPLGGELRTSDGPITLLDVLSTPVKARLVVLSACSTMLARAAPTGGAEAQASGDDLMSLAESFQIAGAENVLATTMHVNDVATAMVIKRFYRAARTMDAASALRAAELVVRRHYPHPAWWATFVLLAR